MSNEKMTHKLSCCSIRDWFWMPTFDNVANCLNVCQNPGFNFLNWNEYADNLA